MKKTNPWKWQGRLTSAALGVTLLATGPAASLGIPEKNTIALLPKEIGVKTVGFIGFADAYGDGWYSVFDAVNGGQKATPNGGVDQKCETILFCRTVF